MAETGGSSWDPYAGAYEDTPLRYDDDGWPLAVRLEWTYNNKFGIAEEASDWLIPRYVAEDGTTLLGKSGDFNIVAVHRDGHWQHGGLREALERLRIDAAGRLPDEALPLIRECGDDRWPTWTELAAAVHTERTRDEIDAWLHVGVIRQKPPPDFRQPRSYAFDLPEDWLRGVGPLTASLLDRGHFIVPWWSRLALNDQWLSFHRSDYLSRPRRPQEASDESLVEWLCQLVSLLTRAGDYCTALQAAWESHLAHTPPPAAQPACGWDALEDLPAVRRSHSRLPSDSVVLSPLSGEQRAEVVRTGDGLLKRFDELAGATKRAASRYQPPGEDDLLRVRVCLQAAAVDHQAAVGLCRALAAPRGAS